MKFIVDSLVLTKGTEVGVISIKSSKDISAFVTGQYGNVDRCFVIASFSYKYPVFLETTGWLRGSPVILQMFADMYAEWKVREEDIVFCVKIIIEWSNFE